MTDEFTKISTVGLESIYDKLHDLRAVNAELLAALEEIMEGRATSPPPDNPMVPNDGIAWRNWRMFEKARAAIKRAKEANK